ncbi:MAG: hypothetical protein ACYTFK_06745 [Planctomycetota bacterium]|jgi:hypothetical protein
MQSPSVSAGSDSRYQILDSRYFFCKSAAAQAARTTKTPRKPNTSLKSGLTGAQIAVKVAGIIERMIDGAMVAGTS